MTKAVKDSAYFEERFDSLNSKESKPFQVAHASLANNAEPYNSESILAVADEKISGFIKRSDVAIKNLASRSK